MKSNSQLQRDVMDELQWEPRVDHANIGVAAKDGIITLTGFVGSYAEKLAAEKAARRVRGVRGLAEEIEIRLPSDAKTADHEIAKRIADMFEWSSTVPKGHITVKVEHGWVTLSGTVDFQFQRKSAFDLASRISAVKGISNQISVKVAPSPADIKDRIIAAFRRNADLDASTITVSAEGNTVKLGGKVHAWYERQIAERTAWSAPGVTRIEDNILIV